MRWEMLRCDSTRTQVRHPRGRSNGGQRAFTYRLKLPTATSATTHPPADGHLTVIAGTLNIGFGDKLDVKANQAMPPEASSSSREELITIIGLRRDDRPVAGHRPLGGGLRQSCG